MKAKALDKFKQDMEEYGFLRNDFETQEEID